MRDVAEAKGLVGGPFGSKLVSRDYVESGVPVIRGQNLGANRFVSFADGVYVTKEKVERDLRGNLAEPGDLVFTQRGTLGQVAIMPETAPSSVISQSQMRLRVDPAKADPNFVYYWSTSPGFRQAISDHAIVAGVPHINLGILGALPLSLPPLSTQRTIASALGTMDDLIENNQRRAEVLEEMAQAIYREWFVRFRYPGHEDVPLVDSALGPIPAGWACVRSGELVEWGVLEIGDGYRAKNSEMTKGSGLPFVRVGNVRDGYLDLSHVDRLPASYRERLKSKVSRPGDTVLCMKGTVGRMARITEGAEPMAYSPQVSFWRSLREALVPASFLHEWLRGESFERQCAAAKGSTAMADYVNLRDQRNMSFLLPTEEVVRGFADTIGSIHSLSDGLRASATRLSDIRDMLLPKLVTGQIDVSTLDLDALVSTSSTAGVGAA